jgi:hypothetical protein
MPLTFENLWAEYQQRRRPETIGDRVANVVLGEADDDVAAAASAYAGMGEELSSYHIARLGLTLADLERVMPEITSETTREYFTLVTSLARAILEALAQQPTSRA